MASISAISTIDMVQYKSRDICVPKFHEDDDFGCCNILARSLCAPMCPTDDTK
jgi:hypothetical protein